MKNIISTLKTISLILFVIVVLQFLVIFYISRSNNYENIQINGLLPSCSDNCFPFSVKAVYSDIEEVEVGSDYTYGGGAIAKICEDVVVEIKCVSLDITKLPGYKIVNSQNGKDFPIYTYINKYAVSLANKKIYFLYRVLSDGPSKTGWVYDDKLAVVSFDTKTREVALEGELSITGINVKNIYVSPGGSSLLIVDANNPRYIPSTTVSNIVLFNLKDKTTKIFDTIDEGGVLNFITWIDDKHFFYSKNQYNRYTNKDINNVIFKVGSIK